MYLKIDKSNVGKYGKQFKGQKRICHNSGRTAYESEMVKIDGKWIIINEVDDNENNNTNKGR